MFDPTIGRWLEQDPIGFEAGDANLYRYVGNGATNGVDPSGKKVIYSLPPLAPGLPGMHLSFDGFSIKPGNDQASPISQAFYAILPNLVQLVNDVGGLHHHWYYGIPLTGPQLVLQSTLNNWFANGGDLSRPQVQQIFDTYQAMLNGITNGGNPVQIVQGGVAVGPGGRPKPNVIASAVTGGLMIRPSWYEHPSADYPRLVAHELSHAFAGTTDDGGYFNAGQNYWMDENEVPIATFTRPELLPNNADAYAHFLIAYPNSPRPK